MTGAEFTSMGGHGMTADEYGIRHRRNGHIHREGMTETQALEWMTFGWDDDMDPWAVFEIVCRPVGDWRPANLKPTS